MTSRVNDVCKLLDNHWTIRLFRNGLGSYTAKARNAVTRKVAITDDFTPEKALYRLVEKVTTGRIVQGDSGGQEQDG